MERSNYQPALSGKARRRFTRPARLGTWNHPGCFVTSTSKRAGSADDETEVVESATIARLVNAYVGGEQTHDKCDGAYQTVPHACPNTCRTCAGNLIFRARSSNSQNVHPEFPPH